MANLQGSNIPSNGVTEQPRSGAATVKASSEAISRVDGPGPYLMLAPGVWRLIVLWALCLSYLMSWSG